MNRHIPPSAGIFDIRKELRHAKLKCKSSLYEQPGFTVLGEYDIIWVQCRSRSHCYAFLIAKLDPLDRTENGTYFTGRDHVE
jgi:hypothetical protein